MSISRGKTIASGVVTGAAVLLVVLGVASLRASADGSSESGVVMTPGSSPTPTAPVTSPSATSSATVPPTGPATTEPLASPAPAAPDAEVANPVEVPHDDVAVSSDDADDAGEVADD